MGPLVMTGLATFGATVGVGLLLSGTYPTTDPIDRQTPTGRGLAIVMMAFSMGIGTLGVVVGLLAAMTGADVAGTAWILAAGPAAAGAIVGIAIIVRNQPTADVQIVPIAVSFVVGMGVLGAVAAMMALTFADGGPKHPISGPFEVLGLVSLASAIGIGLTGARAVRSMNGADEASSGTISSRQIMRGALFQAAGVAASVVAIVIIMLR